MNTFSRTTTLISSWVCKEPLSKGELAEHFARFPLPTELADRGQRFLHYANGVMIKGIFTLRQSCMIRREPYHPPKVSDNPEAFLY